jgi:cytochrome c-type biogenesis protein
MDGQTLPILSALWLGILTSVSPCPLASNIAAVSFISHDIKKKSTVLWAGVSYVFGRILCYTVLGACISASLVNVPLVSHYLQMHMPKVIGPLLVLTGVVLLDLIALPFPNLVISQASARRLQSRGAWGALLLGTIFALAFCPVSAAFFFGSLIPLSLAQTSPVLLPAVYGIGTGLPVVAFAVAIAFGVKNISIVFKKVNTVESWARRITAGALLLIGMYFIFAYNFNGRLF